VYFIDAKKDGKWTEWDENAQMKSEVNYKDGKSFIWIINNHIYYFKKVLSLL
jgi:antitoxin component YwqK of YwqJK toxin-antitoxin module